jgi:predicted metalloendopeptidase
VKLHCELCVVFVVAESDSLKSNSETSAERKAAMYYSSCVDVNQTLNELGSRPLLELLWDSFGGWTLAAERSGKPAVFNETAWDFQRTLEQTHSLGVYGFFSVWVAEDDKMPTRNILQVTSAIFQRIHCPTSPDWLLAVIGVLVVSTDRCIICGFVARLSLRVHAFQTQKS